MKKLLIIPNVNELEAYEELVKKYDLGFEYNEFYDPSVLDDESKALKVIEQYQKSTLPGYATLHGAFFDVIPTSMDEQIRKIGRIRIEQSIKYAKILKVKAIIFHTNYNPFLNRETYVNHWIRDNIRFWSEILEKNPDINIYLENMFDTTPDILKAVSEGLCKYENYGVCLDYAHAALSKADLGVWAKTLGPYVKHIHLNDHDKLSDLHLAWGEGKIERKDFYQYYDTYMHDATILIETSSLERAKKSIQTLQADGFLAE